MLTREFFLAGKATFTIVFPAEFAETNCLNAERYTFRITHKEESDRGPECWFVSLLTGQDNENDFSYLGMLDAQTGAVRLTRASRFTEDSWAVKIVRRVLARGLAGEIGLVEAAGWKVLPSSRCARCNRALTTPRSIEIGLGPDCEEKVRGG